MDFKFKDFEKQCKKFFQESPYLIETHKEYGWKYAVCWRTHPQMPTEMTARLQKTEKDAMEEKKDLLNDGIKENLICIIEI